MNEKHVIGVSYTDAQGKSLVFYIQQDYDSRFTKWIAWSIRDASQGWGIEKSLFFSRFVLELLEFDSSSRIFPSVPHNDHTLHMVDIDSGYVALHSPDGNAFKVQYTFADFHKRVKA